MKEQKRVYTLITGASSGLGKEMAIECARNKQHLILAALPGRNLDKLCDQLEIQFGISAYYYELDMTDKSALMEMANWVLNNFSVDTLINNAGMGGTIPFDESAPDYLDAIIQLNIRATSLLTRLMIPELKRHEKAYILNVSSLAAFSPLPYKTIYPASKAFIYSFSRGLKAELKHTGISVSVIHPGPILTNPDAALRIVRQGFLGKVGLLTAGRITRIALSGLRKEKGVVVPGFMNKVNRILMKVIPTAFRLHTMVRIFSREFKIVP